MKYDICYITLMRFSEVLLIYLHIVVVPICYVLKIPVVDLSYVYVLAVYFSGDLMLLYGIVFDMHLQLIFDTMTV